MAETPALVLLPGLDGTGLLFRPLLEVLPESLHPIVVSYPPDRPLGYRELEEFAAKSLPTDREFVIVAESFSGPIGVRLAARHPPGLRGLVLVASFVTNPMTPGWRHLSPFVRAPLFWFGPPKSLIRRRLTGPDATDDLVDRVVAANRLLSASVIARRVREVLRVDATEDLVEVHAPMLYLRGEADRQLDPGIPEALAAVRPDMEFETIPAPHLILQCEPGRSAEVIRSFMSRYDHLE
jgi:pimeloyl-[acyl-carrier protein] methyl ester esterase